MQLDWRGLEAAHTAYERRIDLLSRFASTEALRGKLAVVAAIRAYLVATGQSVDDGQVIERQPGEPLVNDVVPPAEQPYWPRGDTFEFDGRD